MNKKSWLPFLACLTGLEFILARCTGGVTPMPKILPDTEPTLAASLPPTAQSLWRNLIFITGRCDRVLASDQLQLA
jgi:hypothetical protein